MNAKVDVIITDVTADGISAGRSRTAAPLPPLRDAAAAHPRALEWRPPCTPYTHSFSALIWGKGAFSPILYQLFKALGMILEHFQIHLGHQQTPNG